MMLYIVWIFVWFVVESALIRQCSNDTSMIHAWTVLEHNLRQNRYHSLKQQQSNQLLQHSTSNHDTDINPIQQKHHQQQQYDHPQLFDTTLQNRRNMIVQSCMTIVGTATMNVNIANAINSVNDEIPDTFDVENYLKTGMVMNPMGVSGQAGKSKPETGILLRDGSEVSRDSRTGDVLAEILLQSSSDKDAAVPVLASFVSPWSLASGTVFDVECRNPQTGDGAFLAVTGNIRNIGATAIQDIPDTYFVEQLIGPTGRFSSYGTPTDVKIRNSTTNGNYRTIDISFSTLSQSTQTELPRRARIVATIPDGTRQAVMLIGSASLSRWNKSSKDAIIAVTDSFRAVVAPTSSLRLRAKDRRS